MNKPIGEDPANLPEGEFDPDQELYLPPKDKPGFSPGGGLEIGVTTGTTGRVFPPGARNTVDEREYLSPIDTGFLLFSPAFSYDWKIPKKFSCEGENINPPLKITNTPENTNQLALVMADPDIPGGEFTHWLLWNIDPETLVIPEGTVPFRAIVGRNDFGQKRYIGPCPSKDNEVHRYVFRLYALDSPLNLPEGANRVNFEKAASDKIIELTALIGIYDG